jgi:hypothetical protein
VESISDKEFFQQFAAEKGLGPAVLEKARRDAQKAAKLYEHIDHPPHYTKGGIETLDFIEAKALNYHRGNVVKYLVRAGHKPSTPELEDLRKARFYLNREIVMMEKELDRKMMEKERAIR